MKTSSSLFALAVSSVTLFASNSVESADLGGVDVSIRPRLEVGVMNYTFEQGAIGTLLQNSDLSGNYTQESFKYQDNMPFFGGGLTLFADRFYFDLNAYKAVDGNGSDTISFSEFAFGPAFTAFLKGDPISSEADFDREDYAVTIGYGINDQFSVFGGYKWANTDFDTTVSGPITLTSSLFRSVTGTYLGSIGSLGIAGA